ncbi:hypothetical protein M0805_006673 [Coniferiporia weirii]|nr:hypothetical protein M0805_006673 [Coniferiporia weirii]
MDPPDPESLRLTSEPPGNYDTENDIRVIESYYRLGLEDLEELRRNSKGKGTSKTDAELALDFFAEDAAAILTSISDAEFARSIQAAMEMDDPLLGEHMEVERREQEDRDLAPGPAPTTGVHPTNPSTPSTPSIPSGPYTLPKHAESSTKFPSTWAGLWGLLDNYARRKPDCIVCMEPIRGPAIKVPCGHHYDESCITELFTAATSDESLFPPRCCRREILLEQVKAYLKTSTLKLFEEKSLEFSTQVRLYCSNKTCSRFLGPRGDAASNVVCPTCYSSTCALCSELGHPKEVPCKDDDAAQAVFALGRENGWQQCPGCRQLVELNIGCYHMTCRCRTQFCYLCAAPWKNCTCPQWDEGRLVAAAEQRVQRMPENAGGNGGNFVDLVNREVANLRTNHECAHQNFSFRRGGGRCEGCHHNLPAYLFSCTGCRLLLCNRCKLNRI